MRKKKIQILNKIYVGQSHDQDNIVFSIITYTLIRNKKLTILGAQRILRKEGTITKKDYVERIESSVWA